MHIEPGQHGKVNAYDLLMPCRIQYTSGEFEDLDLNEIIREGHMSLICQ